MSSPIKVAIADDHAITRTSLSALVGEQRDMTEVGHASNGKEVLELVKSRAPDVLVLDLVMPGGGPETLPRIRLAAPATKVLILTGCSVEHFAVKSIEGGVSGFLTKGCEVSEILQAIRTIASGRSYITTEVGDLLAQRLNVRNVAPHEELTEREFQIFLRLARGLKTPVISKELFLSPKTVSTYTSSLRRKLGLRNNAEITHYAVLNGLME